MQIMKMVRKISAINFLNFGELIFFTERNFGKITIAVSSTRTSQFKGRKLRN